MYQSGTGLQTEFHAALSTANIYILNVRSLGEMLHVSGTVKHRLNSRMSLRECFRHIGCHITVDNEDTAAEEFLK